MYAYTLPRSNWLRRASIRLAWYRHMPASSCSVVYTCQKSFNFINVFACYKRKCKLAPFNLAHPVYIQLLYSYFSRASRVTPLCDICSATCPCPLLRLLGRVLFQGASRVGLCVRSSLKMDWFSSRKDQNVSRPFVYYRVHFKGWKVNRRLAVTPPQQTNNYVTLAKKPSSSSTCRHSLIVSHFTLCLSWNETDRDTNPLNKKSVQN